MSGTDPVTPEMRRRVITRDRRECMAPILDPNAGPCRDRWGGVIPVLREEHLTLDHVRDREKFGEPIPKRGEARKHRFRAPSDEAHLVSICWGHHLGGWATAHRPLLRQYLADVHPDPEKEQDGEDHE